MRMSRLLQIAVLCLLAWSSGGLIGSAWAQGTKDPSGLGPTMTFPIRPRNEPGGTTATPNTSHMVPQRTIRLHQVHPYRGYHTFRSRR